MNTVNESSQTQQQDGSNPAQTTPPVPNNTSTTPSIPQPQPAVNNPAQWQVLIIDDEPDNIGVAKLILEFNRAIVNSADSGSAGIDLLKKGLPTFLLLDIQMPKMSGWDVLKVIREDPGMKHLPVIALTAHAMVGDKERILAGGFDGYIAKPVSPITFIDQIKEVLSRPTQ
jgi:two-component system, cell cycle response regulator DivK